MPRINRVDVGGEIYHVLNRANARVQIFDNNQDYQQFEEILEQAVEKFGVRLLAYCIMPNHWHLVLYPKNDGDMQQFMSWLTNTHTRRWHVVKETVGQGHLYQGRYKSFIIEKDQHLLTVLRYVERNAKRAKLVKRAEQWQWSSVWRREEGTVEQKKLLAPLPIELSDEYFISVNQVFKKAELAVVRNTVNKGKPFGKDEWVAKMVKDHNLEHTVRERGRPRKY